VPRATWPSPIELRDTAMRLLGLSGLNAEGWLHTAPCPEPPTPPASAAHPADIPRVSEIRARP